MYTENGEEETWGVSPNIKNITNLMIITSMLYLSIKYSHTYHFFGSFIRVFVGVILYGKFEVGFLNLRLGDVSGRQLQNGIVVSPLRRIWRGTVRHHLKSEEESGTDSEGEKVGCVRRLRNHWSHNLGV